MLDELIEKIKAGSHLGADEMEGVMQVLVSGSAPRPEVVNFLIALRDKGETASEMIGAVRVLRQKMIPVPLADPDAIDTCGTGGDVKGTFNISTAVAFVVAGAGVTVAKHGNRAVSSKSGSADVLRELGVNVEAKPAVVQKCLDEIGIGFLFAPLYHPALKTVAPARAEIGTRTLFNLLGPLLNPAGVRRQVVGVYSKDLIPLMLEVFGELGAQRVALVHGSDGLDEITLTGPSAIGWLKEGKISHEVFDPQSVGYAYCDPKDLEGGDAATNARRLRKTLVGHSEPIDHCVHLNAALALMVAGRADNFKDGLLMAQESISSGAAMKKLDALITLSHQ